MNSKLLTGENTHENRYYAVCLDWIYSHLTEIDENTFRNSTVYLNDSYDNAFDDFG